MSAFLKTEVIIWKSDFKPQKSLNIQMFHVKNTALWFATLFSLKGKSCVSTCTHWLFYRSFFLSSLHNKYEPVGLQVCLQQIWKYGKTRILSHAFFSQCNVCKEHCVNTALPLIIDYFESWFRQLEYSIYSHFLSLCAHTCSHASESLPGSTDQFSKSQPLASPSLCKQLGIRTNSMTIIAD